MDINYQNAIVFNGPSDLGEFIAQIVARWQRGETWVLAWHQDLTHDNPNCDCPKLVFLPQSLCIIMGDNQDGGPQG